MPGKDRNLIVITENHRSANQRPVKSIHLSEACRACHAIQSNSSDISCQPPFTFFDVYVQALHIESQLSELIAGMFFLLCKQLVPGTVESNRSIICPFSHLFCVIKPVQLLRRSLLQSPPASSQCPLQARSAQIGAPALQR